MTTINEAERELLAMTLRDKTRMALERRFYVSKRVAFATEEELIELSADRWPDMRLAAILALGKGTGRRP